MIASVPFSRHVRVVVLLYVSPAFEVAETSEIVDDAESVRRKSRERR